MDDLLPIIEAYVQAWHGIPAPNEAARILAADLADAIRAFEGQRGRLQFEDEPSSFELALEDCKDAAP